MHQDSGRAPPVKKSGTHFVALNVTTNGITSMASLSRTQLETLAEGLLQLQVRLNELTIRLYKAAGREVEMFQTQRPDLSEPTIVMSEEIQTEERSLV